MLHGKQGYVTLDTRCYVRDGSEIKGLAGRDVACEQAPDWQGERSLL